MAPLLVTLLRSLASPVSAARRRPPGCPQPPQGPPPAPNRAAERPSTAGATGSGVYRRPRLGGREARARSSSPRGPVPPPPPRARAPGAAGPRVPFPAVIGRPDRAVIASAPAPPLSAAHKVRVRPPRYREARGLRRPGTAPFHGPAGHRPLPEAPLPVPVHLSAAPEALRRTAPPALGPSRGQGVNAGPGTGIL